MKNIVYFNSCPPFKKLEIFPKTEIVYHACEWDKNYLSVEAKNDLVDFLNSSTNYSFCFMEDMI